ncbi:cell division protein SepF [Spiroplasma endosymbiont of Diplazon laetatorius]|uniref:cell division protein SepF n=1 Tax=Spiroplasma endosymbiont of Diplazon laetatorius TaxID=3066322 RepID=UPI0030CA7F62
MGLFNKKQENIVEKQETLENKQEDYNTASAVITEFNEEHVTHFLPHSYDDTKQIADCLLRFKNVTVKLTEIEREEKKRLIDFLTGVMYALEGDYKKIDTGVYYFWIGN